MMKQVLNKCKWGMRLLSLLLFLAACTDADRSADSAVPGEQFVITVGGIREGAASQTRTEAKPAATAFAETSGGVYINAALTETDGAATTRADGTTPMAVGTTFRVVAYRYPIATGAVAGQAEYTVTSSGVSSTAPLSLGAGAYVIVAYSYNNSTAIPTLTGDGDSFNLPAGQDFLYSPATFVLLEEGAASTALKLIFDRQMARVRVKLDASAMRGGKITNPGKVQLMGPPASCGFYPRQGEITVTSSENTDCVFKETQGDVLISDELFVIPYNHPISLSLEGCVVEGFLPLTATVKLPDIALEAGVSYTLTANLNEVLAPANCFVLPAAGTYKFDATIKGNGKVVDLPADLDADAVATRVPEDGVTTIPASSIASVAVLWETVNTTSAPTAGTIVSPVSVSDGIVTFTTGSTEGNAVIAVKNSAGTVLWSWHIWRTNETINPVQLSGIKAVDGTVVAEGGSLYAIKLMDRNLGALQAVQGNLSAGLQYQWGRKDPFKGAGVFSGSGTDMAITPTSAYSIATGGVTPAVAVNNPGVFYKGAGSYNDWSVRNDNLWGCPVTTKVTVDNSVSGYSYNLNVGKKTIFDPCPTGWRMAPGYVFANAYARSGTDSNVPWTTYGRDFKNITTSSDSFWYPASGYRSYLSGSLNELGTNGYGWLASPYAGNAFSGACLGFSASGVYPASSNYRASGRPLRCMQE